MRINADFDQRILVHSDELDWLESPMQGVHRRPLDRVGGEVARATSIVRYAPQSAFSPHIHTGGEEFIVLEGVFQDEHGDFPVGSYIRNPPQSRHTPSSEPGTIIFVKLWQMDPEDRTHIRLRMDFMQGAPLSGFDGVKMTPLYTDQYEDVALYTFEAGATLTLEATGGAEILVLDGAATESGDRLRKASWLRSPLNSTIRLTAEEEGARVWIKTGHLSHVDREIARVEAS